ncbi:MAG TPA: MoaD/ThiS family protein [Candidatus Kapabacteria bacterium]|nr:MoaD/ThiS family protein [Candidatus Kapabacteria bacterium]
MLVRFHFYSISKELAGQCEVPLDVPSGSTLGAALDMLFDRMEPIRPLRSSSLFAIGTHYARMDALLSEGDIISMIPPTQGG